MGESSERSTLELMDVANDEVTVAIEQALVTDAAPESPRPSTSSPSSSADRNGATSPPPTSSAQRSFCNGSRSSARRTRQRLSGLHGSFAPSHLGAVAVKDESFCDCPQQSQSRELACQCGEEDSGFEWVWDRDSKSTASDLSDDSREVRFHVNYSSGTAAIKGYRPMTDRQHFWEIKMTTPVYGTDIMVGVGTGAVDLNASRYNFCSLLGKDGESWGYSYFGRTQHKNDFRMLEKGRFGQGSIIGVHLDMWHGAVSFYKNRRPLGRAYSGLSSKTLYPMVSSTAARTGMRLIRSCSFSTSLQFLCCQVLRKLIPAHLDVTDALSLPPGLHAFLTNNLSWLLRPCELEQERPAPPAFARKRSREPDPLYDSDSLDEVDTEFSPSKRLRKNSSESSGSSESGMNEKADVSSLVVVNGQISQSSMEETAGILSVVSNGQTSMSSDSSPVIGEGQAVDVDDGAGLRSDSNPTIDTDIQKSCTQHDHPVSPSPVKSVASASTMNDCNVNSVPSNDSNPDTNPQQTTSVSSCSVDVTSDAVFLTKMDSQQTETVSSPGNQPINTVSNHGNQPIEPVSSHGNQPIEPVSSQPTLRGSDSMSQDSQDMDTIDRKCDKHS